MDTDRNTAFGTTPGTAGGEQDLADRTRTMAHDAQQQAAKQVRSGLDLGKSRAAGALHGVADSLLQSCDTSQDGATRYIRQAGEQVQRAADYLEHTDVREMTRQTERFARRQPALFLGAAFGLGLVAARFLKSSERGEQQDGDHDAWNAGAQRNTLYDREQPISGYRAGQSSYADTSTSPTASASSVGPLTPLGGSAAGATSGAGTLPGDFDRNRR